MAVETPVQEETKTRVRRSFDAILADEEAKLAKLREAVTNKELYISGMKERQLDGERRMAAVSIAQELAKEAQGLTPEQISAIIAEVKARKEAPADVQPA